MTALMLYDEYKDVARTARLKQMYQDAAFLCDGCGAPVVLHEVVFAFVSRNDRFGRCAYCLRDYTVTEETYRAMGGLDSVQTLTAERVDVAPGFDSIRPEKRAENETTKARNDET